MAASLSVRRRFRRVVVTVVVGLLAAGLAAPAAAATSAVAPRVPGLDWIDCGDGFQCATAVVPLDYDRPRGAQISLAVIRLPAGDPAHRLGSVFLNPGGPGDSAVDFVRDAGRLLFPAQVRARFDLVGFDPRGIIRSTPLRCFDTLDQAVAARAPFAFPVTPAEEGVWVTADRRLAAACAQRGGPILDHMSTADVARDMDLLRQAVGDRQLTYLGFSYGSYLGATYASLFPGKVRALAVDAVVDPVAWATGRGNQARFEPLFNRLRSAQGADATLGEFFRLCDQGGANCAFSQGDPRRRYAALAKRLLEQPAALPDGQGGTITFTYADLVATTFDALYSPEVWPLAAQALQQLDTLTRPQAAAMAVRALRARLRLQPQQDYPNVVEGLPGVMCSDSDNPDSVSAWKRAADVSDRAYPYFGRLLTWTSSICQPWPGQDTDRYLGPFTRPTSNPVLVVGARFDPITRYQGAVRLARLLPRSRLLTLDGWGHGSLPRSACINAYVSRYLLTTQLPPPGTICQPDVVPFAQPAPQAHGPAVQLDPPSS